MRDPYLKKEKRSWCMKNNILVPMLMCTYMQGSLHMCTQYIQVHLYMHMHPPAYTQANSEVFVSNGRHESSPSLADMIYDYKSLHAGPCISGPFW